MWYAYNMYTSSILAVAAHGVFSLSVLMLWKDETWRVHCIRGMECAAQ